MVEAIVVIADDQYLLKAEASPYMMKDRPIVAFKCPMTFTGTFVNGLNYRCLYRYINGFVDAFVYATADFAF